MALKRLVWTFAFLLFAATAVKAAPVGGLIAGLAGSILSAGTFVKLAIGLAINVGLSLYQQAKARREARKNQQSTGGVKLSIQMGESNPRSYLIGTRATAGRRAYINNWGEEENTPNAYITEVVEISCLPSYAGPQGMDAVWFGDTAGTILWNEPHPDGRGFPIAQYRRNGVDYLWFKYLDGSQTTADSFLLSRFAGRAERPYRDTMIGRGCQIVIITARRHEELFRNGFPQGLYQPRPMRLYDIRKDSSVGGNGPHRWNDPSTWESSNNLPMMIYNIARGIYYNGRWVHGGRNFSAYRFPVSSWIAAINEADRDMGGGRRQFQGGLEVSVDRDSLDVIEDLRLGCSGRLAEVGGRIKALIGAPGAAVYSFTDREIVVTADQDYEPFPTVAATHNTITGVYPEPAQRWADKDAAEQSSPELLARDDGERLAVSFRFDAVFISAQVQSLTSTMILDEQRWRTHELTLPPNAAALEPNDPVAWSSDENGYSNKKFLVVRAIPMPGRLQRVVIKEIDPSDYDPPSIIVPPVIGWMGPVPVPPQPMYGWQVFPATLPDAEGNPRYPSIEVRCAPNQDDVSYVRVQVKLTATDELVFDSGDSTVIYEPPYKWVLNAVLAANADYQARGKFVPASNRPTEFGGWLPVRTPNIDGSDITVGLGQVRDDVKNRIMELQHQMDQLAGIVESLSMSVATSDMDAKLDRDVMRSELGGAVASVIDERETRVTAEGAMARRLSAVRAEMNDVVAEGYLSMKATTIGDTLANVEFAVRAQKGDQTALGAFTLEIVNQGGVLKAQEIHYSDRFIIVAPDGSGGQGVFTFDENGAKLAVANIGTVRAAYMEGYNGKMMIDLNNGRLRVRSS
ncbi:phage tail protein [Agrobacterium salinitolerans]|uniref:phage tail protein n=1 Tax=Agrobacterium salinitolerans TaxID=1183413 RepID=UPI0022B855EA|nr:phage tail protein [Agrobacterium salinitolerans]MCZ7886057.1 phage tail protein [Agrobacterium salinitolerans]